MPLIHDGSAFTSVTYGQVEVTSLTLAPPDTTSTYQDTGINLPAYSAIDYILIKGTTNGALAGMPASGHAYYISNMALNLNAVDGGVDYKLFATDLTAQTGPPLYTFNVYEYIQFDRFDLSWFYLNSGAKNLYFQITTAGAQPGTAAVVDILVGYKTYGTS